MKKTYFKKSISLIMTVLMLMSCWVFVAPEKAEAAATLSTYRKADKYGTPVWDGNDVYESTWSSGSSFTTFTWPKHIYLDLSETLESAGYYYTVKWRYGDNTDYRIVNNGYIFGGWGLDSTSHPANYYTMTNMFNNYDMDASLPTPDTDGGTTQVYDKNNTSGDLYVGVDGLDWSGANAIIWRNPDQVGADRSAYVFMKGTPKAAGTGRYSTSGAKPSNFGGWQYWSSGWKNAGDKYTTSNTSSNWTTTCYEGEWKEVAFDITIYDKADLNYAKQKSDTIYNNNAQYAGFITAGLDNYVAQHDATAALLKTRVTTQDELTAQVTALGNAANALRFAASNSNLLQAISSANSIKNASDYSAKYTYATRKAFEEALANATTNTSYDEGVTTYAINFSDNSTWDAGEKANTDQNNINNLTDALNSAMTALTGRTYDVSYENLFSFSSWANSASGVIGTSAKGTMTYDVNAGTITFVNNASNTQSNPNDHYSSYGFANNHYNVNLTPGEEYFFQYTTSGGTGDQVHIFFYDDNGNAVANPANRENPFANAYGSGNGTSTIYFAAPEGATKAAFRFGTTVLGETVTFSDMRLFTMGRGDEVGIADWTVTPNREVFEYNALLGTKTLAVPERPGYTFNGWWVDSINANGTKDDGEQVSDGEGNVVEGLKNFPITQDWVLYSEWTVNKYKVKFVNAAGTTVSETEYDYGTPASDIETPSNTAAFNDVDGHHTFAWPTIEVVTGDVTYTEAESIGAHTTETKEENRVEATCAKDGSYVLVTYCSVCDTEISRENKTITATGAHTWTEATCTAPKTCSVCGATEGEALGHTPGTAVKENEKEATCTAEGSYDEVVYCSVCNEELSSNTVTVPKKDHQWSAWAQYQGDATHRRTCSVCSAYEEGSHTFNSDVKPKADSTSFHDYKCDLCDARGAKLNGVDKLNVSESCFVAGVTYSDNGDGNHTATCICGRTKTEAHWWSVTDSKDATCTEAGYKNSKCDYCPATKEETIPAAHTLGEWAEEVAATCVKEGTKGHYTCSECGKHFDADENEISDLTIAINDNHVNTENKAKQEPTCTEVGYEAGVYCNDCQTWISGHEKIEAKGHSYSTFAHDEGANTHSKVCSACGDKITEECTAGDWVVSVNATCMEKGSQYKACTVCAYKMETEEIPTIPHNYGTEVANKEAGTHYYKCTNLLNTGKYCTEYGNEEACSGGTATCTEKAVCAKCQTAYGDALGHDFSVFVSSTAGDCQTVGTTTYKCSRCDVTNVVNGEYGAHSYESKVTAPTCTEDGYTTYTCSICNDTYKDDEVTALGHTWTDATCTAPKTCSVCDATEGEALGHTWVDATCTAPKTCSVCDATEGEALGHDFSVFVSSTAGDCQIVGTTTYKCSRCDETNVVEGAKGEHSYKSEVTAPTCTEDGYTTYTCSRCGDSYVDSYVDANGHSYDDGAVTTEPTCTTEGVKTFTCSACGDTYTEKVDATGHTEEAIPAVDATCEDTGLTSGVKCSVCGEILTAQEEVPALGHKYEVTDHKDASCTEDGYDVYTCKNDSKHTYTTVLPKFGHTEEAIPAVDATCEDTGLTAGVKCSVCGEILTAQEEVPALGHKYEVTDHKDASCTEDGYDVYTCKNDSKHTYTTVLPKLGHTEEAIPAVDATCEDTGLTSGVKCSVCGEILTAQEEVPALGHKYEVTDHKDASCTEDGYDVYTCKNDSKHTYTTVLPKLGHTEEAIPAVDETCEDTGLTAGVKCSVCGEILTVQEEVPALGHKWEAATCTTPKTCLVCGKTEGTVGGHTIVTQASKAPTCEEDGFSEGSYCSVCGEIFSAQIEFPATGHIKATRKENIDPATCQKEGYYDLVTYCETCGKVLSTEGKTIGKTEHAAGSEEIIEEVKATCKAEGYRIGVTSCSVCDEEISRRTIVLPKLKHSPTETPAVKPTCETTGLTEGTHCEICGTVLTAQKVIPATGHTKETITATIEAATCTKEGVSEIKVFCTVCDKTLSVERKPIPMAEHTPADEIREDETPATCGKNGKYTSVINCSVCGAEISRRVVVIPSSGEHDFTIDKGRVEPTCTENGYIAYACTCGAQQKTVLYATGHIDKNGDLVCDDCGAKFDNDCGCLCHKDHWFIRFIYKIVRFFWKLFRVHKECYCTSVHY